MSAPPSAAAATAKTAAQSLPKSSTSMAISEAERGLFLATKYHNYCLFIQSVADYIPSAQPWATSLRLCPLIAFRIQVSSFFSEAIEKHRSGDNHGRDIAASSVVREQARNYGLELSLLRADDLVKLLRYAGLFSLLVAEEQ